MAETNTSSAPPKIDKATSRLARQQSNGNANPDDATTASQKQFNTTWLHVLSYVDLQDTSAQVFPLSKAFLALALERIVKNPLRVGDCGDQTRTFFTPRLVQLCATTTTFIARIPTTFHTLLPDFDGLETLATWQCPWVQLPKGVTSVPLNKYGHRNLLISASNVAIRGAAPPSAPKKAPTEAPTTHPDRTTASPERKSNESLRLVTPLRPSMLPSLSSPSSLSSPESPESQEWPSTLLGSVYIWSNAQNVRLTHVRLRAKNGYGVFVQENATATLIHCNIEACGSDAVLTHGEGTTLTMIGCAVHHNQGHGIHADDLSEIVVRGNTTISHNDRLGIAVQVGARVVLESGSITHNDDAGVEVDRAGVVRLHDGFLVRDNHQVRFIFFQAT
jgi:hypothetical protein